MSFSKRFLIRSLICSVNRSRIWSRVLSRSVLPLLSVRVFGEGYHASRPDTLNGTLPSFLSFGVWSRVTLAGSSRFRNITNASPFCRFALTKRHSTRIVPGTSPIFVTPPQAGKLPALPCPLLRRRKLTPNPNLHLGSGQTQKLQTKGSRAIAYNSKWKRIFRSKVDTKADKTGPNLRR